MFFSVYRSYRFVFYQLKQIHYLTAQVYVYGWVLGMHHRFLIGLTVVDIFV